MTRTSRSAVVLCLVILLLGLTACSKPEAKQLKLSRDAVRAAKAWEEDVMMANGNQQSYVLVEKVECPSRRDLMWETEPPRQLLDNDGRLVRHDILLDGNWYTSDGRYWRTFKNADKKPSTGCGEGPTMVGEGRLAAVLDEAVRNGEIHLGPKMTENGYDCSWFDLSMKAGDPPQYTVCVNESSHLPQVVRSRELGHEYTYTLSQWNTASVGLPPELNQ